jgi:hypothetical protein
LAKFLNKTCPTFFCPPLYAVKLREHHYKIPIEGIPWLDHYNDITFFRLFRMNTATFQKLLSIVVENDHHQLLYKVYRGGHRPVETEKALLVFLWYMATQDTLLSIGKTFQIVPATIHRIVNNLLFVIVGLKNKFIVWPKSQEEVNHIAGGFTHYPSTIQRVLDVLGALDGSHINIKVVPWTQRDSYVDRYMSHSINAMVISNVEKILLYAFIGFPGAAHDSRVLH